MSDKTASAATSGMITLVQAGALLMITDRWVRDLVKKGYVPPIEGGKIPLVGAVQGYIRWLKDEERRTSKTATLSQVQQERALEIRQRRELMAGNLLELDSMEAFAADVLGSLRSELSGVPAAVTRDAEMRSIIEQRLNDALTRARNKFAERSAALRSGSVVPVGDEEGDS